MKILLNDTATTFPSSLSEFTLGQRIDFYNQYGRELDEMAQSILAMEDGPEKELEVAEFQFEKLFRTFAFFANCSVEAVKESELLDKVAEIYYSCLAVLFEEENNMELQQSFTWKGEEWEIHPPELKHGSSMEFGELIDSKQVVKDMIELGKGRWEYMLPLCAVYLRKKGEAYDKSFLFEDSERLKLMRELPMDIALQVGFFLSASLNMCMNISLSSSRVEPSPGASIVSSTSIDGAGQTSLNP